jgi:hypothetical protein
LFLHLKYLKKIEQLPEEFIKISLPDLWAWAEDHGPWQKKLFIPSTALLASLYLAPSPTNIANLIKFIFKYASKDLIDDAQTINNFKFNISHASTLEERLDVIDKSKGVFSLQDLSESCTRKVSLQEENRTFIPYQICQNIGTEAFNPQTCEFFIFPALMGSSITAVAFVFSSIYHYAFSSVAAVFAASSSPLYIDPFSDDNLGTLGHKLMKSMILPMGWAMTFYFYDCNNKMSSFFDMLSHNWESIQSALLPAEEQTLPPLLHDFLENITAPAREHTNYLAFHQHEGM